MKFYQKSINSTSPNQTKKLGKDLAKEILKLPLSAQAFVIGLEGNLGSGKTTFLQGFADGLGIKQRITSPTFVIIRKYKIFNFLPPKAGFNYFYHIDCYRVQKPEEILDLGFRKIIRNPKNIVAIEWAEKIKEILPKKVIWFKFEFINKNIRRITVENLKIKM